MQRAYSIVHVKSVDGERRVIRGVATTPEPDRVGDIVEPLGVKFKNPLPLLLHHDSRLPVGQVRFSKATAKGIEFEAKLADPGESATLKDRVDEAWASVKAGLIQGVSIGFRALEDGIETLRSGGVRFTRTEVLELSLVAIPANASATITSIKSADAPFLAESGNGRESTTPNKSQVRDAHTATGRRGVAMATIQDQIKSFQSTRESKSARMSELMTSAGENGVTLDADQEQEYDNLEAEVKSIDAHLSRLERQEQMNRKAAQPVLGSTPVDASASRVAVPRVKVTDNLPPGIEFARMVMCKAAAFVAMQQGEPRSAVEIAKERYPDNTRIHQILQTKAAVAAGTSVDSTWAGPLVYAETLANEFVEYLRPQTLVGRIPGLRRVPANVRIVAQASGGNAGWVGEGKPKPLTKFDLTATTLGFAKIAAISVITEELARYSSPAAETIVRDGLTAAIVERMDIDFIDPSKAAVSNVSPASITNGLTPLEQSGTSADNVRTDIGTLMTSYLNENQNVNGLVLVMPTTVAMVLSLLRNDFGNREFPDLTMNGGTLEGIPVVTTQYAAFTGGPGNLVIAINAPDIFLTDDGAVTVDISREASLEMSDAPTQSGTTGVSLVSMWQNNMIALRAERHVNWAKRRTNAVAYIQDVGWGGAGSPS